jgi:hypothetical protein
VVDRATLLNLGCSRSPSSTELYGKAFVTILF